MGTGGFMGLILTVGFISLGYWLAGGIGIMLAILVLVIVASN